MIKLIYMGQRLNGKKLVHAYNNPLSPSPMYFSKALAGFRSIGTVIEAEEYEGGVKNSKRTGFSDVRVTEWSIEERADLQAKKDQTPFKADAHLDSLIWKLKTTVHSYSARRRLALYIYQELLK